MKLTKLLKDLPTGFQEEADAMSEVALRNVIVESSHNISSTTEEMKSNDGYKQAKENLKAISIPYRDAMKTQKAKIAYALKLLEQKGKI